MIKKQLGEPLDGEYPQEFVARYPELAGAVKAMPVRSQAAIDMWD